MNCTLLFLASPRVSSLLVFNMGAKSAVKVSNIKSEVWLETVYWAVVCQNTEKNSVCDKTQTLTKRIRTRGDRIKKTATPLELLLE